MTERIDRERVRAPVPPRCLRVVRIGHGGNCSSVGSVVDTLFLGAAAGGAIFAALCAAMEEETVTVVGAAPAASPEGHGEGHGGDHGGDEEHDEG